MKKAIVIGGGFTGCTWAHLLSDKKFEVTLIEKKPYLGGGCKTFTYGGHPYTLGPRHLFCKHHNIFEYLDQFTKLRSLNHYLMTYVAQDGNFYSYPPHKEDIMMMPDKDKIENELKCRSDLSDAKNFEEYWISSVGKTIYNKFVNHYSKKMWQIESNVSIDDFKFDGKGISLREGTREVNPDWFIAYPYDLNGWDNYFEICTSNNKVQTILESEIQDYDLEKSRIMLKGEWIFADLIISSISPDTIMGECYGKLPYIGRELQKIVLPIEQIIPDPVFFIHYSGKSIDEPFTRIVEYKKLTGYKADSTLLGIEIPSKKNKLYPYPIKEYQGKAKTYLSEMPDNILSVGRMGNYLYMDIGDVVGEALERAKDI